MKRNPRKLKWTKAFRKAHGKEMTVDSTLAFAARRNIPTRYNRDLVATTLRAMQRVSEIRAKRERVFYRQRMQGNRARQLEADRKLVAENQHLLPPQDRDLPPFTETEEMAVEQPMEEELEEDLEEEVPLTIKSRAPKIKQTRKLKMVRGGGVDGMDVD